MTTTPETAPPTLVAPPHETASWPLALILAKVLGRLISAWRVIAIGTIVGTAALGLTIFSLRKTYQATSTMLITGGPEMSAGILGALASKDISSILGSTGGNSSQLLILSQLGSRTLAFDMIRRHRLDTAWRIPPSAAQKWELQIRAWSKSFGFEIDEEDNLMLSFQAHDPRLASRVLGDVALWIDSAYQQTQRLKAKANAAFIGERLTERRRLLWSAEDSLVAFQQRTGSFLPSEQLKLTAEMAAKQEAYLEELRIQQQLASSLQGENSAEAERLQALMQQVKASNSKLWSNAQGGNRVLRGIGKNLESGLRFERLRRDVLMHGQVYAFLMQQYEQFGLEATRNVPLLTRLDPPLTPTMKKSPPRMALLVLGFLVSFSLSCGWVLSRDSLRDFFVLLRSAIRERR